MTRDKLFTIPRSAFRLDFFRAGGKGGQKQNKTSSAARVTHLESGAVGESREERSQPENRKRAFYRMAETAKFRNWVRLQAAAVLQGYRDIEHKIDRMLRPENIKYEIVTAYTCDTCGRSEKVCTADGEPLRQPARWVGCGENLHACDKCRERAVLTNDMEAK